MRRVQPIQRQFRYLLSAFGGLLLPRNWYLRRVLYLLRQAHCLLTCEGATSEQTTNFFSTGNQVIRVMESLAKRTIVFNEGAGSAVIFENDVIIAFVASGKSKTLPLEGKGTLRAEVTIAGGFSASINAGAAVSFFDPITVTGATEGFALPGVARNELNEGSGNQGKIRVVLGDFYVVELNWILLGIPGVVPPTHITFSFTYAGATVAGKFNVPYGMGMNLPFTLTLSNGLTPLRVLTYHRCECSAPESPYDSNVITPSGGDLV